MTDKLTLGTARGRVLSRRSLLKASGASALALAVQAQLPGGAFAQAAGPEIKGVKLGFIALTDACPLIVAKEKGYFAKHGMPDVEVMKQASWPATRDNLAIGGASNGIDGAHILTPMPYLMTSGKITQNSQPVPMAMLARLHLDGQSISVSNEFKDPRIGVDASPLRAAIAKRKAAGKDFTGAHTFPGGTHDLWIRYWLAAGGIDPDNRNIRGNWLYILDIETGQAIYKNRLRGSAAAEPAARCLAPSRAGPRSRAQ